MNKRISFLILSLLILVGGYFSYKVNTGRVYKEYTQLWEYRLLHPETLPDTKVVRLTLAGNTSSYADILWMELIQYIGDNIVNDQYHNFLNPFVEKIIDLHPHFTEPYNLSLMLSPSVNPERVDFEKRKLITENALRIGEMGIEANCDEGKLSMIYTYEFGSELWENSRLKNPCNNPMLAYNVAITANELSYFKRAEKYFKVASMQEDGPQAARFLGPLMDAKLGDNKSAGERFLLIALSGYDESPFSCHETASHLLKNYKSQAYDDFVLSLKSFEENLKEPTQKENLVVTSGNTCYGFTIRAIKQFYLAYIANITKDYPEITTGSGILEKGILKTIPTINEQKGWTVIKKNGQWRFIE